MKRLWIDTVLYYGSHWHRLALSPHDLRYRLAAPCGRSFWIRRRHEVQPPQSALGKIGAGRGAGRCPNGSGGCSGQQVPDQKCRNRHNWRLVLPTIPFRLVFCVFSHWQNVLLAVKCHCQIILGYFTFYTYKYVIYIYTLYVIYFEI